MEFDTPDAAQAARNSMDGAIVRGRAIAVQFSQPRRSMGEGRRDREAPLGGAAWDQ